MHTTKYYFLNQLEIKVQFISSALTLETVLFKQKTKPKLSWGEKEWLGTPLYYA